MYQLTLDGSAQFQVRYKNHQLNYSVDNSFVNPLEATYAALAGCAGVYARKAAQTLGISTEGIDIHCKPVVRSGNMLIPQRFVTDVTFPDRINSEQRAAILESIRHCAVKELVQQGSKVEFVTNDVSVTHSAS